MILFLDTETYSPVPIQRGTHVYAEMVEVIMYQWAVDAGPVQVGGPDMRGVVQNLVNMAEWVVIQNSAFDRIVCAKVGLDIPVHKIWDTMIQARAHGLPGGLAALCDLLGVPADKAKDKEGKRLINLFCKPPAANLTRGRATPKTHPEEWAAFELYGKLDVEAMREIYNRLPRWNYQGFERKLWELDVRVNERGFQIDLPFVRAAIEAVEREKANSKTRVQAMTGGQLESATQRDATLRRLRLLLLVAMSQDPEIGEAAGRELAGYGNGINDPDTLALYEARLELILPDLQKGTLEKRLEDDSVPQGVKELIAERLLASNTSTAKYRKLLQATSSDGRLRGALAFCGASRTGRWAGRLFQPQNLPRPAHTPEQIEEFIAALKTGVADFLFDDVIPLASSSLRGVIVPAPGHKLVAADLSNIEGRVLAWLAGEGWKLDAFRAFDAGTGPDLYLVTAGGILGKEPEQVTKLERQNNGKVPELACGYQGAVGAFASMAALYGLHLPEEQVLAIVKAWRKKNSRIVAFWYALERAVRDAIDDPGRRYDVGRISARRDGNWLRLRLPSGRFLCYPSPALDADGLVTYMGVNQYSRRWERLHTYGGKLAENVTQAVARDVMADAMMHADARGYKIVLTVHDELVTEVPDTPEFSAAELENILATNPTWAAGLPLAAEGFEAYRYGK